MLAEQPVHFVQLLVSNVKLITRVAAVALLVGPNSAGVMAHPGHGEVGPMHYVTSPEHILMVVAFLVGISLVWSTSARRLRARSAARIR